MRLRLNNKPIHFKLKNFLMGSLLCATPALLHAQIDFNVDGRDVQIHGFLQQGFAYSNQNNFLTMDTSKGTFALTDAGANISTSITDNFRVGAQVYARNIGALGDYHLSVDWAYADYKFKSWLGIRGGKVKTALGLLNDTQDAEFLYTWAIMPQSIYPLDLRSSTIAHTGADLYGEIPMSKAGGLSYTAYAGMRASDPYGGTAYGDASAGTPLKSFKGRAEGVDLRWHTPVTGLMFGSSWANQTETKTVSIVLYGDAPLVAHNTPEHITSGYADFARGKWHLSTEYRRDYNVESYTLFGAGGSSNQSTKGWFGAVAYRAAKWLELGTYNSRFYVDKPQNPADTASNHIFDQTVTARFDLTRWWNIKIEEHFMNGYGDTYSAHGFYSADNPAGLKPTTNMFVIRTGFYM